MMSETCYSNDRVFRYYMAHYPQGIKKYIIKYLREYKAPALTYNLETKFLAWPCS